MLRLAVELGVTFFDTANAYGPRTVNQLIGQALRPLHDGVIVGNKVGAGRGPDRSWIIVDRPDAIRLQVHEALQNRFSLLDRGGVQVLADCEAHGISFVPTSRSPPGGSATTTS